MSIARLTAICQRAASDKPMPRRRDLLDDEVVDVGRLDRREVEKHVFGGGVEPDLLLHLLHALFWKSETPSKAYRGVSSPRQSGE